MTDNGVTADLDGMNQSAQQFQQIADATAQLGTTLANALEGLGNFGGSDATGQAFAQKYTPAVTTWMSQAGVAGYEGLPGIADTVTAWTRTYDDAVQSEQTGASALKSEIDGAR